MYDSQIFFYQLYRNVYSGDHFELLKFEISEQIIILNNFLYTCNAQFYYW
jgi:hypothetical protein